MINNIENATQLIKNTNIPLTRKNRAIFYLRNLNSPRAAQALQECITNRSVLLDHEIAYVLGQMKQEISISFLLDLAGNEQTDPIVRHEAIEALGNFEKEELVEKIEKFLECEIDIIRESAELAIEKLKQKENPLSKFNSRDPANPSRESNLEKLQEMLLKGTLIEKYEAMFKLRDLNTVESVKVLSKGFSDNSQLLKHEIAYVFGQMENKAAIDSLEKVLSNEEEGEIVRHEAAESLGSIGGERSKEILERHKDSTVQIVRESCEVGLTLIEMEDEKYLTLE
ncbi:hypothetical protein NUSPORA_00845 [Nucleospora cyclopteri]